MGFCAGLKLGEHRHEVWGLAELGLNAGSVINQPHHMGMGIVTKFLSLSFFICEIGIKTVHCRLVWEALW